MTNKATNVQNLSFIVMFVDRPKSVAKLRYILVIKLENLYDVYRKETNCSSQNNSRRNQLSVSN